MMSLTQTEFRFLVLFSVILSAAFGAAAQQQTETRSPDSNAQPSFQERYPRYTFNAGDSFDLSFEYSPEYNQTVSVQPDGFVSLRGAGDVHVSGLTLPEVSRLVEAKYQKILYQPTVSVMPREVEKRYFIATGEVTKPGRYELHGETTVAQAIGLAGGFAQERAKHSEVVLFRREGGNWAPGRVVDIKKMFHEKNLREDMYVKPGDLVYVPQNRWSKTRQFIPIPGIGLTLMPGQTF